MMDIRNIKRKIMQAVTAAAMTAAVTAGICMTGAVTAQAAEQTAQATEHTAQTAEQKTGADSSVQASKVNINIVPANKESTAKIKDGSYSTSITFTADNTLTITPADANDRIYGLYITWAARPGEWTLTYDGGTKKCGRNAFLHEYVEIPEGTTSAVIELSQKEKICNIDAYSAGTLPDDVQVWEPECARADMLVLSTHADDEILFLGGVLAQYAGEDKLDVQVVYFSNYFGGTVIREHEKLDGLWELGVRHYPVNGDFPDQYADDLAAAEKLYGHDEAAAFVVEQIRRFKPQVCVAQDTDGEYGHGTHKLTSAAMQEAVTVSMDSDKYPESAAEYGVWNVAKTYIHLYGENKIKLDCRQPLDNLGGRTALEAATAAYKKHVSQQWCWFYVSDTYEYSISDFGLYRTTVGEDTGNDMMEHITSYEEQEKQARQQAEERRAKKQAEEESKAKAEYELQYGVPVGESSPDKVPQFLEKVGITIILMIAVMLVIALAAAFVSSMVYRQKNMKKSRRQKRGTKKRR